MHEYIFFEERENFINNLLKYYNFNGIKSLKFPNCKLFKKNSIQLTNTDSVR